MSSAWNLAAAAEASRRRLSSSARLGGHNGVGASRVPTVREEVAEVGGEVDGRETVGVT
jgi:hypothetical protein